MDPDHPDSHNLEGALFFADMLLNGYFRDSLVDSNKIQTF
jgi:hypothetical protein